MTSWQKSDESIFFFLALFLEKTAPNLLVFVHYNVIQLRYFRWNYFLNNFSLLDGLLRRVCLLMVHSYFIMIKDQPECRHISWSHMFLNSSFCIGSHEAPISCFFWTSFLFFFRLVYLSTHFLSSLTLESWVIY